MTAPPPGFVAPMLATPGELPSDEGWTFEPKWDGVRAVVRIAGGAHRVWTRNAIERTVAWPELEGLADAVGLDAVLDGELVAFDADGRATFGAVQRRMHVASAPEALRVASEVPAALMVFDLLELDGRALFDLPLEDRRRLLDRLGLDGGTWRRSPVHHDGAALLAGMEAAGMEGVVAKRRGSPYRPGRRSADWRKVKVLRREDVVVGGWTEGTGRRAGSFGALVVGVPVDDDRSRLRHVGRVGTGFTDADLDELTPILRATETDESPFVEGRPGRARWVRPSLTVEVRYGEWTGDGLLRHPSYVGRRLDV